MNYNSIDAFDQNSNDHSRFGKNIKHLWTLDESIFFLNNGSFGATPLSVIEEFEFFYRKLELSPVRFFSQDYFELLENAKIALSEFVGCNSNQLVFTDNASSGVNTLLNSILQNIKKGSILYTDHSYPSVLNSIGYYSDLFGFERNCIHIPFPDVDKNMILEIFDKHLNDDISICVLDHVSSPTAIVFPIKEICIMARERGIITLVDGAHAPGLLDLNINELNCDLYTGNCHKWLFAPKNVAMIWVGDELISNIKPLNIANFYHDDYQKAFSWSGTKNLSAVFSVPRAIDFYRSIGVEDSRNYIYQLRRDVEHVINNELRTSTPDDELLSAMCSFVYPKQDYSLSKELPFELSKHYFDKYKIEIPFMIQNGKLLFRISCQVFNYFDEYLHLLDAIKKETE